MFILHRQKAPTIEKGYNEAVAKVEQVHADAHAARDAARATLGLLNEEIASIEGMIAKLGKLVSGNPLPK